VIPQRSDDRVEERREVIVDFGVDQVQTLAGVCFICTRRRTPPRDKGLFPRCEVLSKVWVRHEPESGALQWRLTTSLLWLGSADCFLHASASQPSVLRNTPGVHPSTA